MTTSSRAAALATLLALLGAPTLASAQSFGGTLTHQMMFGTGGVEIHIAVTGPAAVEVDARQHGDWACTTWAGILTCRTAYFQATGEQFHPSASTAYLGGFPQSYTSPPSGHPAALLHLDPDDPREWVILVPNSVLAPINIPLTEHDPVWPGGQFRVWSHDPEQCVGESSPEGPAEYYAEFGITSTIPIDRPHHFFPLTGCTSGPG